jgi:predicted phage baseplate assembly protein
VRSFTAPIVDDRSVDQMLAYWRRRLSEHGFSGNAAQDPMADALLRIAARYCELIITRLNQAPEKNYLAFLNLIGVTQVGPVAASAPITFSLVKQLPEGVGSVQVPEGTKVAAPPGAGDSEPVVFETTRSVMLTSAALTKVIALDPQSDRWGDHGSLLQPDSRPSDPFTATMPVEHGFYIAHAGLLGKPGISELRVRVTLAPNAPQPNARTLEWFLPTREGSLCLTPHEDTTGGLTQTGEVVFRNLPKWSNVRMFDRDTFWLGCRLSAPLPTQADQSHSSLGLPSIRGIRLSAAWQGETPVSMRAFVNTTSLDVSKDFFPFGESPRFGDTFYLSCPTFAHRGAQIAVTVKLVNSASAGEKAPITPTHRLGKPVIRWESWTEHSWQPLTCTDTTHALTEDGFVSFAVPSTAAPTAVNGQDGAWIRAVLASGDYGQQARFEFAPDAQLGQAARRVPSTLAPPVLRSVIVGSAQAVHGEPPEAIVVHNNLSFEVVRSDTEGGFLPFRPADHKSRAVYFAFSARQRTELAGQMLDLYFQLAEPTGRLIHQEKQHAPPSIWRWQCWNGVQWVDCRVVDDTGGLTASGLIRVQLSEDIASWRASPLVAVPAAYWIRGLWTGGAAGSPRLVQRVLLNTVDARHIITVQNELLGSSSGRAHQTFRSARTPLVGDLTLEVREFETASGGEFARRSPVHLSQGWMQWKEVNDILRSDAQARHFLLNRLTGEIEFGDGIRGMVPPPGANNIRLRIYRAGGGANGNQPAGAITQLRTTLPFIASATNPYAAVGGRDAEDRAALRARGARLLRHRGYAVTAEDYEDLACEASAHVARAKCCPLLDLAQDPKAIVPRPGAVSVIVVPHGTGPRPKPTARLLSEVHAFLRERQALSARLVVAGPEYVAANVHAEIMVHSSAAVQQTRRACELRLTRYLHPLAGGPREDGWAFGALAMHADLLAVLRDVDGVAAVRHLQLQLDEERDDLMQSAIFLLCPGNVRVDVNA